MLPEEQVLLKQLRQRDQAAFSYAVRRYSGPMLATALGFFDKSRAEDIVQDTWLTVVEAIDGFEGRSSLKTWLCSIVANRARNRLRNRWRETSLETSDPSETGLDDRFRANGAWSTPFPQWDQGGVEQVFEAKALEDCLNLHIESLPDAQRAVLTLSDFQHLGPDDVCRLLDISYSNLRTSLHRARNRIMVMIEKFRDTGEC